MTDLEGVRGEVCAPVIYLPGVRLSGGQTGDAETPATPSGRTTETTESNLAASHCASAHHVALKALGRRGLSRREMERALQGRDFDDDSVAEQIERLERVGLVDDRALAQNLVGTLQERKGLGRSAIAAELTRRLLAPAAIAYALELVDTGDEIGRARELAIKRARQLRGYDHETAVRRLSGYLARRGYSGSTVRAAVDQALPRAGAPRASGGVRFR